MAVDKFQLTVEAMTRGEGDLKRLEDAVNRFSVAAEKSGKVSKGMGDSIGISGAKIRDAMANPLAAATEGLDSLAQKFGTVGAGAAAFTSVIAATGVAVFKLASAYGNLYEQQSNNAARLGVSIREYSVLSRVSEEAGLSGDALVGTMRGLAKALSDTGEEGSTASRALQRLGVNGNNSFGALRPMNDILLDIADRLGAIQNPAEKADLAMKILGRSGLEVLPLMTTELRSQVAEIEKSSLAWDKWSAATGAAVDKAGDDVSRKIAEITKELQRFAAEFVVAMVDPSILERRDKVLREDAARWSRWDGSAGRFDSVIPADRLTPSPIGAISAADLAAVRRRAAQAQINSFTGTDPKERLTSLRSDLATLTRDAVGPEDVARVRALTAEIRGLEASIKAAEDAAKRSEKLKQYAADVFQYTLMQPGAVSRTGFNLSNPGQQFVGGPSLLGEKQRRWIDGSPIGAPLPSASVNRGTLGTDPATYAAQQERSLAALRAGVEYQARKVELLSGAGGEIAAIQQTTALRLSALEQERALGTSIFEIERQRQQILQDGELRILEIQRQRQEANRQTGQSIFDALLSGGSGIKGYASSLGLGIARTASGNAYDMFASGIGGRLSTTNDPNSFLGKLFANTPLGAKDEVASIRQMTAADTQLVAAQTFAASVGSIAGVSGGSVAGGAAGIMSKSILGLLPGTASYAQSIKGSAFSTSDEWFSYGAGIYPVPQRSGITKMGGIAAGVGAGLGVLSGVRQGGAGGALTALGSAAGGAAAILPALSKSLSLAGPIGGAIAVGAALAMAFLPDPKQARQRALEEQARQRQYDEATGTEYVSTTTGRSVDYAKNGGVRVYLSVNAMDSQSIIDRQADIGEAVRQALSSYPPLASDIKGTALGA